MARVMCRNCGMAYRAESGRCPECGAKPPARWRHTIQWRWQLPIAIGLGMQLLSLRIAPPREPVPDVVEVSTFLASTLIFALVAALLLYGVDRSVQAWRRSIRRKRRAASRDWR